MLICRIRCSSLTKFSCVMRSEQIKISLGFWAKKGIFSVKTEAADSLYVFVMISGCESSCVMWYLFGGY